MSHARRSRMEGVSRVTNPRAFADLSPATEQHFRPAQLAKLWGCGEETVRKMFDREPGVLRLGERGALRRAMRIPQSVAERVHRERVAK